MKMRYHKVVRQIFPRQFISITTLVVVIKDKHSMKYYSIDFLCK